MHTTCITATVNNDTALTTEEETRTVLRVLLPLLLRVLLPVKGKKKQLTVLLLLRVLLQLPILLLNPVICVLLLLRLTTLLLQFPILLLNPIQSKKKIEVSSNHILLLLRVLLRPTIEVRNNNDCTAHNKNERASYDVGTLRCAHYDIGTVRCGNNNTFPFYLPWKQVLFRVYDKDNNNDFVRGMIRNNNGWTYIL
mmetsp:Transcript_28051/g.31830  ORF Transcript_28051/g.31830 Transcript_28051/m.31830 type:complete len:196 (+) Transcript_28051:335-922(+)